MSSAPSNDYRRNQEILQCGNPAQVLEEIRQIILLMDPDFDCRFLQEASRDLIRLFTGDYPGFGASNTKYHNLEHTCAVALALIRLVHGMQIRGNGFSGRVLELGVLAAFFHDVGLLPAAEDQTGTGAKHMIGHEQRSISIMAAYLAGHGRAQADIDDCGLMIDCTTLMLSPMDLNFNDEEVKKMGCILGTADLLAQMADRCYLEKLPLLYLEFNEAGIVGYNSTFELLKKTGDFYTKVALKRLNEDLDGVIGYMRHHFQARWGIDEDLYAISIRNQMQYLEKITEACKGSYPCLLANLRRKITP